MAYAFARMFALTLLARIFVCSTYIALTRRYQWTNVGTRYRDIGRSGRFCGLVFLAESRVDPAEVGHVWYRWKRNFLANSLAQSSERDLERHVRTTGAKGGVTGENAT